MRRVKQAERIVMVCRVEIWSRWKAGCGSGRDSNRNSRIRRLCLNLGPICVR